MDFRWAGGDINRIRAFAQELVGLQADILMAGSTPATFALQRETRKIPIVIGGVIDPVASGLVASLNRPGGNITGFGAFEASLGGKWLELLSEMAPWLKRAAVMFNPETAPSTSVYLPSFETAARSLKVVPITALVHDDVEIEMAIIGIGREPRGGLVVVPDRFMDAHRAADRGRCHEPTPVTPHYAPFASYKTAGVHYGARERDGLAANGGGRTVDAADSRFSQPRLVQQPKY
jgi:putative ABC transport system substrate-binding protein